jgi:hypothetical protein
MFAAPTPLLILLLLVSVLLFSEQSSAAIQLPKNMSRTDREEALRIIGFGTSGKLLTDPYPLGGYAGFETGISIENLNTYDLGQLGSRLTNPQQDVAFPKLTLGKGFYNNVDIFLHFTPYNRQDELSFYGAILRWGFYQAKFLPLSASVVLHMNSANFSNLLITQAYGSDIIGGINVDNVSLFAGGGLLQSSGTFLGGPNGITDNLAPGTTEESATGFHALIGANVHLSNLFLTIQIDRYTQPVYSGKVGVRF